MQAVRASRGTASEYVCLSVCLFSGDHSVVVAYIMFLSHGMLLMCVFRVEQIGCLRFTCQRGLAVLADYASCILAHMCCTTSSAVQT